MVNQLVDNVKQQFDDLPVKPLEHIFLTLKLVVLDIICKDGDNNFIIKHHRKSHIENNDMLQYEVVLDEEVKQMINMNLLTNKTLIDSIFTPIIRKFIIF